MAWRARIPPDDTRFRPPGRPPISRPTSRTNVQGGPQAAASQPRVPRPLAPQGTRRDGGPGARPAGAGAAPRRAAGAGTATGRVAAGRAPVVGRAVPRPVSAPMVRNAAGVLIRDPFGGSPAASPAASPARPRAAPTAGRRPPPGAAGASRARAPPGRPVRPGPTVRPRSAAALQRGGAEQLNTSVAVQNRTGPRGKRTLTAMAVGPQAPPGSPPRPRQVIIPAGAVDENDTTVLDVPPASPLEQPQRVIIPAGTVHADETMVVVVPAPRSVMPAGGGYEALMAEAQAQAQAEAQARAERERIENENRVQAAKQAYIDYLATRTDKEAYRLRRMLHGLPGDPFEADENLMRKAEAELWDAEMPEVPDVDIEPADLQQPYRLQMSMNIEEFPPSAATGAPNTFQGSFTTPSTPSFTSPVNHGVFASPGFVPGFSPGFNPASPPTPPSPPSFPGYRSPGHGLDEAMANFSGGELSDIEPPDSFYGEDANWEPVPPQPLLPAPEEDDIIPPLSPPRYLYQGRPAPHDPGDLMWEWEEPPRPAFELPILPEPESYSAELFRLVRL